MYVQAMENFPGAVIDEENRRIYVDSGRFMDELPAYLDEEASPDLFRLSPDFSSVYRRFLALDLSSYKAIRGQVISPVSLVLQHRRRAGANLSRTTTRCERSVFSFIQKKVNVQYAELAEKTAGPLSGWTTRDCNSYSAP